MEQQAKARKLSRLAQFLEIAPDPAGVFQAASDLLEAMVGSEASPTPAPSPAVTAATSTGSSDVSDGYVLVESSEELALTLCAALSEPVLRRSISCAASLSTMSAAGTAGTSPSTGTQSGSNASQRKRTWSAITSSACDQAAAAATAQLHHSFSAPPQLLEAGGANPSYPAGYKPSAAGSLDAAADSPQHLPRSLSTVHMAPDAHRQQQQQHPARSASSSMQLQELLQHRYPQQERSRLHQLSRQLQHEACLALEHPLSSLPMPHQKHLLLHQQKQQQQQQWAAAAAGNQQQPQDLQSRKQLLLQLLLLKHRRQQQQLQQDQASMAASCHSDGSFQGSLLDRVKKVVAINLIRKRLTRSSEQSQGL
jgi:hypothetical protein